MENQNQSDRGNIQVAYCLKELERSYPTIYQARLSRTRWLVIRYKSKTLSWGEGDTDEDIVEEMYRNTQQKESWPAGALTEDKLREMFVNLYDFCDQDTSIEFLAKIAEEIKAEKEEGEEKEPEEEKEPGEEKDEQETTEIK